MQLLKTPLFLLKQINNNQLTYVSTPLFSKQEEEREGKSRNGPALLLTFFLMWFGKPNVFVFEMILLKLLLRDILE